MHVLCYGDRNWSDLGVIERELSQLPQGTVVMHGGYIGADIMVGVAAKTLGLEVNVIPLVRGVVGPARIKQMLIEGKADLVLIFHTDISRHRGASHLYHLARERSIPTRIITS